MKQYALAFCALVLLAIGNESCVNSTTLGSDLLEEDQLDLNFTDTVTVLTSTQMGDSIRTFSPLLSLQLPQILLGNYNDPIFGNVRSSIYAQVSINGGGPDFSGAVLDSVILVLPYNSSSDYGVVNGNFGVEVLRVIEDIDASISLYSDTTFVVDPTPIGAREFYVLNTEEDYVEVLSPKNDSLGFDEVRVTPHLRIPLETSFAEELFNADEQVFETDSAFTAFFKGFYLNPTIETGGLVGFNLRTSAVAQDSIFAVSSGIVVYYHTDTTNVAYRFPFSSGDLKMASYQHDYTGAVVEEFIGDPSKGDSLFFIQGLAGTNGIIEFPFIEELAGNIILNKAELVFNLADLAEDNEDFDPITQLTLAEVTEDGTLFQIEDVARATVTDQTTFTSSLSSSIFGGNYVTGDAEEGTYSMNITAYLQGVLKGELNNKLRVTVHNKPFYANRAAFYGGGHSEKPVKLRLYYTKY